MSDGWSPKELLAKLSTKGMPLEIGRGGSPLFTMEDIAGALTGLPFGPYSLARVKYCLDAMALANLESEVTRRMMILARRHDWRGRPEFFQGVARVVITEVLTDSRCRSCGGTGYIRHRQCGSCAGTGVREMGHRAAAQVCHADMKADAWRKTWAPRYKELLREIQGWDGMIEGWLRRRLRRVV